MKTPLWFGQLYNRIPGGWRTWGPNSPSNSPGAFASDGSDLYPAVNSTQALKLAAWYACLRIRAELMSTLPLQILDAKNNVVTEHDLYGVLRYSPNADMTGPEFWSATVFNTDQFGNSVSVIDKWANGTIRTLTPYSFDKVQVRYDNDTEEFVYKINGEDYTQDRIFINKSFSTDGYFGIPGLQAAANSLGGQVTSNDAAARSFKNALRVGGFFKLDPKLKMLDKDQRKDFNDQMNGYSAPENQNKWMPLPPGFEPVGGQQFRVTAADAELLNSRYFGIEELCRFLSVPPPLIGHTDKASSWASSLENLNLFFVTYSVNPTTIRMEARIGKQLFTEKDKARGLRAKFNTNALMRGDVAARLNYYKTMQDLGNLTTNQVLALEDMPGVGPEGDVRRVALNTGSATNSETNNEA